MAETKAPRGQQPLPRKPEPRPAHSPANGLDMSDVGTPPPGFNPLAAKRRHKSWLQRNRNLATGMAVGGLALVLLAILGWQLGWSAAGRSSRQPPRRRRTSGTARGNAPTGAGSDAIARSHTRNAGTATAAGPGRKARARQVSSAGAETAA